MRALGATAADRKLIVVYAPGGWDITRVFADAFGNANVDMEPFAAPATAGGLSWVSHFERPSVDVFFQNFHDQAMVLNGIMVRSIYTAEGRTAFDELSERYKGEVAFRRTVDRYMTDFEWLLRNVEQKDPSGRTLQNHLVSDSGRVYLFLAHASGRLR